MRMSEFGDLMCPYICLYSNNGECHGGLIQCHHLKERAKVCLEEEKIFLKMQMKYCSKDDPDDERYLQDIKNTIRKYEKILEADRIDVVVKKPSENSYKSVIDACVERRESFGSLIVEYANGIGSSMQQVGGMVLGLGELYAEEIYYYEMKYIMDCPEIPGHKNILQKDNCVIYMYYNPRAKEEGKAFNFIYEGTDIYGTVVFIKQIEKEEGKKTVSLNESEIDYIKKILGEESNKKKNEFFDIEKATKRNDETKYCFYTKIVGVTQEKNRQLYASRCVEGEELELVRERTNPYDSNAIAVYSGIHQVGYIKKEIAAQLAEKIDNGKRYRCYVEQVTGGNDWFYGVNIKIVEG